MALVRACACGQVAGAWSFEDGEVAGRFDREARCHIPDYAYVIDASIDAVAQIPTGLFPTLAQGWCSRVACVWWTSGAQPGRPLYGHGTPRIVPLRKLLGVLVGVCHSTLVVVFQVHLHGYTA